MFRAFFSDDLQRLNPLQSAPSPVGEGWGEGILRIAAIFPTPSLPQIQTLRLVALSLALSHGREDGVAVGMKGSARKQVVLAAFLLFRRPASTVVNPSCLSNRQNRQIRCNLLPPPWGRVGERAFPEFRQPFTIPPTAPNTSLAACCPLSSSLPRERGRGGCWDEGFCKENRLCRLLFAFQTTFINAQFSRFAPYYFQ